MHMDKNCDECYKKDMKRKKEVDYSIVLADTSVLGTYLENVQKAIA